VLGLAGGGGRCGVLAWLCILGSVVDSSAVVLAGLGWLLRGVYDCVGWVV
jgi:hypothetical protein